MTGGALSYRRPALGAVASLALGLLIATACGGGETPGASSPSASGTAAPATRGYAVTSLELPISVAVSMPLVEDFVHIVAGDNARTFSLVPAGVDPHSYRLTEEDIGRLAGVEFYFVNGLGLDTAISDVIDATMADTSHLVPFAPNINSPQGGGLTAEAAKDDAHLWLDPLLARVYPEIIADEFDIYDGVNSASYDGNFQAYAAQLRDLTNEIDAQIKAIPAGGRKLVTFHDSFAHFARRFGLEVAGYGTEAPSASLSQSDIDRLVSVVRDQGVSAVFAEYGYDSTGMAEVASAAGVPMCTLYSDIVDAGASYIEMMRANAAEIVRCLGGS